MKSGTWSCSKKPAIQDRILTLIFRSWTGFEPGWIEKIVKMETDRFLKMLVDRKHGINDVAADEIYNFVLSVRPAESTDSTAAASPIELGPDTERPISVPDHTINTPYQGGKACGAEGCDYWLDDVYDPGAAG